MSALNVLTDGLRCAAMAFTTGMIVHCFFDDRINVTLKKLGAIFIITSLASLFDSLLKTNSAFGVLTFTAVSVCPPVILQFGTEQRFTGYIRNFVSISVTELFLAIYSIGIVSLGKSLFNAEFFANTYVFTAVFIAIGIIVYILLVRHGKTLTFRLSDKLLAGGMCLITLIFVTMYNENGSLMFSRRTVEAVFLLLLVLMPVIIYKNRQSSYYSEMSKLNESYLEAELASSKLYHEAQEETTAFRHDIRNNLNMLSVLIKEKNYEEAERYIADLTGGLAELSPRIITGDDMLDSLISSKLNNLERNGIELTVNGVIDGGLDWKPIDICAVFANAIDNAEQACLAMPEKTEKYIRLSFRKTELQRVITISNSTACKVDCSKLLSGEGRYTSKNEKSLHGFGLRSIRRTVEKYGGIMQLSSDDYEFRMTIVLT